MSPRLKACAEDAFVAHLRLQTDIDSLLEGIARAPQAARCATARAEARDQRSVGARSVQWQAPPWDSHDTPDRGDGVIHQHSASRAAAVPPHHMMNAASAARDSRLSCICRKLHVYRPRPIGKDSLRVQPYRRIRHRHIEPRLSIRHIAAAQNHAGMARAARWH